MARSTAIVVVSLIVALWVASVAIATTASQTSDVYVQARQLADGRIEFALLVDDQRLLPQQRYFATGGTVGQWRFSSPVQVENISLSDELSEGTTTRITARRVSGGKVEFGLQVELDGRWSETLLPTRRFFPANARIGHWLRSSAIDLLDAQPQRGFGSEHPECVRVLNALMPSQGGDGVNIRGLNVHINPSVLGAARSAEQYLSQLEFYRADPDRYRFFASIRMFAEVGITFNSPFILGDGTTCPGQFAATLLHRNPAAAAENPKLLGWLTSIDTLITRGAAYDAGIALTVAR